MGQTAIKLSENVLIQCPLKGFELRKVRHCFMCEHYQGIAQATVNGEPIKGDEADVYQVLCAKPITRKLIKISED